MVSKRRREKVLKALLDEAGIGSVKIDLASDSIRGKRFASLGNTIIVLESLGLIQFSGQMATYRLVTLTAEGLCYFENKSDKNRERWFFSILIPLIVSIIIQFVIPWIIELFSTPIPVQP